MPHDIIFNAVPRCGNAFLNTAVSHAIAENIIPEIHTFNILPNKMVLFSEEKHNSTFIVHSFFHIPSMLRLPQEENFIQFTTLRKPEDVIISYTLHGLANIKKNKKDLDIVNLKDSFIMYHIKDSILDYKLYLDEQFKNNNAEILLFQDIINNTDFVLEKILNVLHLEYKNKLDINKVHDYFLNLDKDYKEVDAGNEIATKLTNHIPYEKNIFKERIRELIKNDPNFNYLEEIYNKLTENIKTT
jgi:hypothetical protein